MSGTKIRSKFTGGQKAGRRAKVRDNVQQPVAPSGPGPSRVAQMLSLAHHVERLIEAGELTSYTEAASSLGLTRARLTQVMNLMLLAPEVQERVFGREVGMAERSLRRVVSEPLWVGQLTIVEDIVVEAHP